VSIRGLKKIRDFDMNKKNIQKICVCLLLIVLIAADSPAEQGKPAQSWVPTRLTKATGRSMK